MPASIVIPDSTAQTLNTSLGSSGLAASNVLDSAVLSGSVLRPEDLELSGGSVPGSPGGPPFNSVGYSDGSSFYGSNHARAHQFSFSGSGRYIGYRRSLRFINRRYKRRGSRYYIH